MCASRMCPCVLTAHTRTFRTNEPRAGLRAREKEGERKRERERAESIRAAIEANRSSTQVTLSYIGQDEKCNESISSLRPVTVWPSDFVCIFIWPGSLFLSLFAAYFVCGCECVCMCVFHHLLLSLLLPFSLSLLLFFIFTFVSFLLIQTSSPSHRTFSLSLSLSLSLGIFGPSVW